MRERTHEVTTQLVGELLQQVMGTRARSRPRRTGAASNSPASRGGCGSAGATAGRRAGPPGRRRHEGIGAAPAPARDPAPARRRGTDEGARAGEAERGGNDAGTGRPDAPETEPMELADFIAEAEEYIERMEERWRWDEQAREARRQRNLSHYKHRRL